MNEKKMPECFACELMWKTFFASQIEEKDLQTVIFTSTGNKWTQTGFPLLFSSLFFENFSFLSLIRILLLSMCSLFSLWLSQPPDSLLQSIGMTTERKDQDRKGLSNKASDCHSILWSSESVTECLDLKKVFHSHLSSFGLFHELFCQVLGYFA